MNRIERIQYWLGHTGLDAIILKNEKNRQYAVGFPSSDGTVIVTQNEAFCFLDSRYIEAGREKIDKSVTVGLTCREMPLKSWIATTVYDCKIKKIGFEDDSISYADYRRLEQYLSNCELIAASKMMINMRSAKDENELGCIKKAQRITERVFDDVLKIIKTGVSERELAAEITYRHLLYGASGDSFAPIVVSGKNSSLPHGVPSDKIIQTGDFITMDIGCVYGGYCSDMTRTVAVRSATDEMKNIYDVVLKAQMAGIAVARAGMTGAEVDKAGRDVIEKAGYGEYFGHSFGHSVGLDIHESPSASPSEEKKLPIGAVITAEPGIYLPEKFGVRIEDMLYIEENSCKNLTSSPKNLIIL